MLALVRVTAQLIILVLHCACIAGHALDLTAGDSKHQDDPGISACLVVPSSFGQMKAGPVRFTTAALGELRT